MAAPQKAQNPAATGQSADENQNTAIFAPNAEGCNAKLTANWIAAFALAGFSVHRLEDGAFLVSRWNLSRHCPDLRTLIAFGKQVGAQA